MKKLISIIQTIKHANNPNFEIINPDLVNQCSVEVPIMGNKSR